jgi:hypothetical protein
MALKHTHKLPRRLWDDEKEKPHPPMRGRPQGGEGCGPSCKERRTLWKEELSSLSTLVGTVATLLAVITPSEGVELRKDPGGYPKWKVEPGMEGQNDRLLDGVADHRDGDHGPDHEDPEASRRDMEAGR